MKTISTLTAAYSLLQNIKIFHPEKVFSGKRVAVIGAANTAFEEKNGEFIDSFDLVVRVNKALNVWTPEDAVYLGKKTDILYHSYFENEYSGGGPVNTEDLRQRGVKYLVQPHRGLKALITHLNFYKRHPELTQSFLIDKKTHNKYTSGLHGWTPTVGFAALASVLSSACTEVYISGFTFFKTPYARGYRDHFLSKKENQAHIERQGIHNPELEYLNFLSLLKTSGCRKISCDKELTTIISADEALQDQS